MLALQLFFVGIILIWAFFVSRVSTIFRRKASANGKVVDCGTDLTNNLVFLIPIFALLLFVTVFRNSNTGVDYPTYEAINYILRGKSWISMWSVRHILMEPLLLILMKILSYLNMKLIPFLVVTGFVVLFIYYKQIRKHSKIAWLSMLILVCLSSYFTIFNTTSQMFACIMTMAAAKYIYSGEFKKYLVAILVITLFHKTAIFMIPMYFLLRMRFDKGPTVKLKRIALLVSVIVVYFLLDFVLLFSVKFIFPEYLNDFERILAQPVPLAVIVRPVVMLIFLYLFRNKINFESMKERVWANAIIYFAIMSLLSIRLAPLQRFTYFLLPYATLLIPLVVSRLEKDKRRLAIVAIVMICILYVVSTNMVATTPFSFIWS